jgi:DNA polymerase (family 10)
VPVHNEDIARVFDEIADLLEIQGANPFRVRAYRNGARTVRQLQEEVADMVGRGDDLTLLPNIGTALAEKMVEIVETGTHRMVKTLEAEVPPGLAEMLQLPGLGPKRVAALHHELDIRTIEQLHKAAKDGRLATLPGLGPKTEARVLEALEKRSATPARIKLAAAAGYASALIAYLERIPGVKRVVVAGSFRRARETVGDLDILVTASGVGSVMDRFCAYDEVRDVIAKGPTRATVILRSGLQVDLRLVPEQSFGSALHYFTGSKDHNIEIRRLGQERGLKINEYGVFRGTRRVGGETEESVFAAVRLPWIPPELRENRGEIEAARSVGLPHLVELADIKGDLHAHTRATDGHNTIRELTLAATARGLEYIAITEHSRRLTMAHGLTPARLRRQIAEIDRVNSEGLGTTVLKGIEVDILEDGELDLPDSVLAELDLVIGAVHSRFELPRAKQTDRILRAMDGRYFSILAHPSGRLMPSREPYDVDMPRIIRKARDRGCFLELNAHPERLDLTDSYCRIAKEEGVLIAINSDAHRADDFENLRFGVGQARRGWLERDDVLNTRSLRDVRTLLARTMQ